MLATPPIDPDLRLTSEQQTALTAAYRLAYDTVRALYAQALALHESVVPLGTPSADGRPVPGHANSLVRRQSEALVASAKTLSGLLPDDLHALVRYEHRYVGQGFVSPSEMHERHAHLLGEIPRLRALFDLAPV